MGETAEQQRVRLYKKRVQETDDKLVKCLECNLSFVRVGSHVVQVHGYESASEYRRAHGLIPRETLGPNYRQKMHDKLDPKVLANLEKGINTRFTKGGGHAEVVKKFWEGRKKRND